MNTRHSEMAETYKSEFESRDNGQRVQNPALDWKKVTSEVAELDNRNAGMGYASYSQRRVFDGMTHEQATEWLVKNQIWQ